MRQFLACAFTGAVLVALAAPAAVAAPFFASPTADELARMRRGEVLLTHRLAPRTGLNVFTAAGVIRAPWEKVLRYYADVANTRKFQTAIRKLTVLESAPLRRKAAYELALPWPIGDRRLTLDIWASPEGRYIEWKRIDGNIKEQWGSYAVTALGPAETLVSYRAAADLDTWVPAQAIAFVQRRTIPDVVTKAREDLE